VPPSQPTMNRVFPLMVVVPIHFPSFFEANSARNSFTSLRFGVVPMIVGFLFSGSSSMFFGLFNIC
jgi:hypothetical protein